MGHPSNTTSGKHQNSTPNATNAPPSKRQKTSDDSSGSCPTGVLTAISKLTKLVARHPQFQSKLEGMLQNVFNILEPEVSALIRKDENADSCPLFKLSNDSLNRIFGYVGDMQYGFVAGTSDRFHQVYGEAFGDEKSTSIENAAVSVSRAQLCLGTERPNCDTRAKTLFQAAAYNGNLEVLKWGQSSGYELDTMLEMGDIADVARNGHLEVVKYLRQLGISWDEETCAAAAEGGHLELLKWARLNQCPWNSWTCTNAAAGGQLELLKWARVNQCPWDEMTCTHAAASGHLELLKWARVNQCPWDVMTCAEAAANGHLEFLKWLRANQCPWNEETCSFAANGGHLELLKRARLNGCPWDADTYYYGEKNGDPVLMDYLEDNGCPH